MKIATSTAMATMPLRQFNTFYFTLSNRYLHNVTT
jgi:hypothetical protein